MSFIGSNPEMVDGVIEFNKTVSRVHCKITCVDNRYYICDMGSSNGTYLNGLRLQRVFRLSFKQGTEFSGQH